MSPQSELLKSSATSLTVARTFAAPRELLWRAWTDPKQMVQWFIPSPEITTPAVKVDLRVGGKYRIQTRKSDGEYFTAAGVYREIKPLERLVFTWAFEKDGSGDDFGEIEPPETQVTVDFHSRGAQTEVVLTHEKFVSVESRNNHERGWTGCFEQLVKFIPQSK